MCEVIAGKAVNDSWTKVVGVEETSVRSRESGDARIDDDLWVSNSDKRTKKMLHQKER